MVKTWSPRWWNVLFSTGSKYWFVRPNGSGKFLLILLPANASYKSTSGNVCHPSWPVPSANQTEAFLLLFISLLDTTYLMQNMKIRKPFCFFHFTMKISMQRAINCWNSFADCTQGKSWKQLSKGNKESSKFTLVMSRSGFVFWWLVSGPCCAWLAILRTIIQKSSSKLICIDFNPLDCDVEQHLDELSFIVIKVVARCMKTQLFVTNTVNRLDEIFPWTI